jgi:hypothetical protein
MFQTSSSPVVSVTPTRRCCSPRADRNRVAADGQILICNTSLVSYGRVVDASPYVFRGYSGTITAPVDR